MPSVHAIRCTHIPSTHTAAAKKKGLKQKKLPSHLFKDGVLRVEKAILVELPARIKELEKALQTSQTQKARELFSDALSNDPSFEQDVESLYYLLKSEEKTKIAFENFVKLLSEHAVREAVRKNDPTLLESPLAKECEIHKNSKDFFIKVLHTMGTPEAKILAQEIAAISKIPFKRHKLQAVDMLEICLVANQTMKEVANEIQSVYRRSADLNVCRSCVFDPINHTFTILSKSHGDLQAEGAFKRVSDAVEVSLNENGATARRVAHVRNKADEYVPYSELVYERAYGQLITWLRYQSKNRPEETKTLMLQEVYDHDMYVFTEFWPKETRKKISLEEMIVVLEAVGETLLQMHEDGVVHRDFKAKNVLYRKTTDGKVEAKVIDFGHTYVPKESHYVKKRKRGYGTLRYTAPDLLENPSMKGNPFELAKAEDAYALGEFLYECYLQKASPWGSHAYRALKKGSDEDRQKAIKLQKKEAARLAKESEKKTDPAERQLYWIMSRLLEPDPKKRMLIPEFMSALYDLKAQYATLQSV
jgi:hypothetical protein